MTATIEVEYEVGARVVAYGRRTKATVVAVTPAYKVQFDGDAEPCRLRFDGEHIERADPEVGDRFTGDDDPYIASLPDGTVIVSEDGVALLRRDGEWVDGWRWTSSGLDPETTFAVLHLPKEVV